MFKPKSVSSILSVFTTTLAELSKAKDGHLAESDKKNKKIEEINSEILIHEDEIRQAEYAMNKIQELIRPNLA